MVRQLWQRRTEARSPVHRRGRRRSRGAVIVIAAMVLAACAQNDTSQPAATTSSPSDEPSSTTGTRSIEVTGPERNEEEIAAIQTVLDTWGNPQGITVTYVEDADWESNIRRRVESDDPPDISFFPPADTFREFARGGVLSPLDEDARGALDNWSSAWNAFGYVDGSQYGVPVKADLKSLVWYQPQAFTDAGFDVPTTFEAFTELVETMTAAGGPKALCVGIQSGQSTGWIFAEWVADMVLRQHGPDTYDQWVTHDIPFTDKRIVDSMQAVLDLWAADNVFANGGTITSTPFQDNAKPLTAGECFMHRQAPSFSIFMPDGTPFADGSPGAVDVFYFPDINGDVPLLGAVSLAAAFNDDPHVHALLVYLSTADYANARQAAQRQVEVGSDAFSGFLSAAIGQDLSAYSPLEQRFIEILVNAATVRLDASQTLPTDVTDTFWAEGTAAVDGDKTASEAAAAIEASWPA